MPRSLKHIFILCALLVLVISVSIFFFKNPNKTNTFQQIDSFAQAFPELNHCDTQTLVLFDIDDTLISTTDIMGTYSPPLLFKLRALIKHPQLFFRKNWEYYYSILWQQTEWFVLEPDIIPIIADLKNQGCSVLGLTSMETGTFGIIKDFPKWRSQILADLGIEFSHEFTKTIFCKLPKYRDNYPELYDGILCCNQQSKGSVVAAFLDHFKLEPNSIIFFDDSNENLASVADVCKQRNIRFKGFQYQKAEQFSQKWDAQKALLQLDYLIQNEKWLSDNNVALVR